MATVHFKDNAFTQGMTSLTITKQKRTALITGASSGIGRATALLLAENGFNVILGARRKEALEDVSKKAQTFGSDVLAATLDVRNKDNATEFVQNALDHFQHIDVLINNAGLARGLTKVADQQNEEEWQDMVDTNIMGLMRMTRLVLPSMIEQNYGHIVNLGSTAGHEAYAGSSVYCATKFGVQAITTALRQELLGHAIRVTSVDPGMVETEFSMVRFSGDKDRADSVYAGTTPLTANDIADIILFAVTRKNHVNLDDIIVRPVDQASGGLVYRHS